jgi:hypothetical protein
VDHSNDHERCQNLGLILHDALVATLRTDLRQHNRKGHRQGEDDNVEKEVDRRNDGVDLPLPDLVQGHQVGNEAECVEKQD